MYETGYLFRRTSNDTPDPCSSYVRFQDGQANFKLPSRNKRISDRKSVNAALMYMNGMLVSWHCNKQSLVALSTMESEFVSATHGIREAMSCYYLVKELGQKIKLPIKLRMDNQAAIASIMDGASSSKSKHVDIKHKFIKDLYRRKIIQPSYVTTNNMKADILTKIMPGPNFVRLRTLIGINDPNSHKGKIRWFVIRISFQMNETVFRLCCLTSPVKTMMSFPSKCIHLCFRFQVVQISFHVRHVKILHQSFECFSFYRIGQLSFFMIG
jgi:hypothetical protein